jgi:hypothetical protein
MNSRFLNTQTSDQETAIAVCYVCVILRRLSYLDDFNFQQYTSHVILISLLSNASEYHYVTRPVSSVVAYWSRTHGVVGSNSAQLKE